MERKRRAWTAVGLFATPIGLTVGRLHLVGPNPSTYFVLGALTVLSAFGVIYGFREARRAIRSGKPIGS